MTEQELQQALQEDAPQVILLKNEAQWNLWCKKQLEESSSEKYERQVADGFWVPEEDGTPESLQWASFVTATFRIKTMSLKRRDRCPKPHVRQ